MPRPSSLLLVVLAALAILSAPRPVAASPWLQEAGVELPADMRLRAPERPAGARDLPVGPAALSFDVRLAPGSKITIQLNGAGGTLVLDRSGSGEVGVLAAGRQWRPSARWGGRVGWRHVEVATGPSPAVAVDGRAVPLVPLPGGRLGARVLRGAADVTALVATPADRADALLLHRLAALHARTRPGRFPIGAGPGDRLRFAGGWTSGFWPGALWQASDLTASWFGRWALAATLQNLGRERIDTHDLGFLYGRSSLAAHQRLCGAARPLAHPLCPRLRRSVLTAAERLLEIAASNRIAGAIPTRARTRSAEVLIDTMMNLGILTWANRATGNPSYARVAARHAYTVAGILVRRDGSTSQSAHIRRRDGRLLEIHTHQGLSATSTWARGQAWALYGYAQTALELRDPALLVIAERLARFVAARLPADGVPRYDYDAGPAAPLDVSAGAITAAGMFRLDTACRSLGAACAGGAPWALLGSRMLDATLGHVSTRPPLGRLGDQVYTLGGKARWDDRAELIFGLDYALEAMNARAASAPAWASRERGAAHLGS